MKLIATLLAALLSLAPTDACRRVNKSFHDCHNESLSAIPRNRYGTAITSLDLSANQLASLQDSAFHAFPGLQSLFLNANKITRVDANAFVNTPDLRQVNLAANRLRTFDAHTFAYHDHLYALSLSNNRLHHLLGANTPVLYSRSLAHLALDSCRLTRVRANAFQGVLQLEHLDLRDNSLATLPANVFRRLANLTRLHLGGNAWNCSREFVSAVRAVREAVHDRDVLTCVGEEGVRRKVVELFDDYVEGVDTVSTSAKSFLTSIENLVEEIVEKRVNESRVSTGENSLLDIFTGQTDTLLAILVVLCFYVFSATSYVIYKYTVDR